MIGRYGVVGLVAGVFALAPWTAEAGGFYITDIGTRGMARAGAFVAAPDSLLAIHYNPAGLSLLSGAHFEVDGTLVNLNFDYQRSCPCVDPATIAANGPSAADLDAALEAQFAGNSSSTNSPLVIPFIAAGYGFPVFDLTVAIAAWGPNSGNYEFGALPPAQNPTFEALAARHPARYSAISVDTLEANFALGFGLQPITGLRVGGAVMLYQNANDQDLHLWLNTVVGSMPERTDRDVPITLSFRRNAAINWSLGAIYQPIPGLSLGASFRGKRSIRSKGTLSLDLPPTIAELASVEGRDIEIEINTPPITRLGVEYAIPQVFRAEVAFVHEYWATYRRILVRPQNIVVRTLTGEQTLPEINQPRNWQSTYSLRIGGEFNLFEPFVGLRGGYFYEPSAIPTSRLDASRLDLDKHGLSLGLATQFAGFTFELSGMYIAMIGRTVTNSEVKITAPLAAPLGDSSYATTVGNGRYDANYFLASASVSFAIDPFLGL